MKTPSWRWCVGARRRWEGGLAVALCLLLVACAGPPSVERPVSSTSTLLLRPGEALAVIGLQQAEEQRAGSRDRRVGFGLTHLLAESLSASGQFRLVEDKEVHKRALLEDLVQTYWVQTRPAYATPELRRVGQQLDVSLLAYGTITTQTVSRRVDLGPFTQAKDTLHVRVTVCLYAVASQTTLCREGEGTASQTGTGVIYEFRQDRLDFEQNAIGKATHQAVRQAVQALTACIHFTAAIEKGPAGVERAAMTCMTGASVQRCTVGREKAHALVYQWSPPLRTSVALLPSRFFPDYDIIPKCLSIFNSMSFFF